MKMIMIWMDKWKLQNKRKYEKGGSSDVNKNYGFFISD